MRISGLVGALGVLCWLGACEGPAGKPGVDGAPGADGADGTDGADGADGTDGSDGSDGADGADGTDGFVPHEGDAPWGVNLEILSVAGGSGAEGQLQVGDTPVVSFTVVDDAGLPYDLSELSGLSMQLAGPTEHRQIWTYYQDLDVPGTADWDGAAWTFTFPGPLGATYHAPPNDTTDLGEDAGDWGGLPVVDGTYTLAAWAYHRIDEDDGTYWYDADDASAELLVGAATTLDGGSTASESACLDCHGDDLYSHGGSRRALDSCLSCHVSGAEDRYSATDASTTPGVTVAFDSMIHKIHNGASLSQGFVVNGYPADPEAEGYPDYNVHDFSDVVFPAWPMEAATCDSCHAGATGADYRELPTRQSCGACHDAVDFSTGDGHGDSGEGGARADDSECTFCHSPSSIDDAHADPRADEDVTTGLVVTLLSVGGGTGTGGALQAGDTPSITFSLADADGNALSTSDLASATAVLAGPLDHMQWVLESSSGNVVSASTYDSASGAYSYTFASAIPSTYPAQKNDTEDIGLDQGDWYGEALVSGTYRVALMAYRNGTDADGTTWRVPDSSTLDVLVGDATSLDSREVVTEAACTSCHTNLEFHGRGRQGLDYCVMCHTAGGEDRNSSTAPDTTPGASIEMGPMIHKIHMGEGLSQTYELIGFSGTTGFNEVVFPRLDGGVRACDACHGDSDAWQTPSTSACTSCHDSEDAAAHAEANTHETYGESCEVCHGAGAEYAAETVHAWPR